MKSLTSSISFFFGGFVTMTEEGSQRPMWPCKWADLPSGCARDGIKLLNMSGYMIK